MRLLWKDMPLSWAATPQGSVTSSRSLFTARWSVVSLDCYRRIACSPGLPLYDDAEIWALGEFDA